ncbi:MAG: hypothetical protein DMG06_12305 [Acidobacteria bacterium]|nr:MAG: hypothetical protein DMG06_12305 [Acidobacteriota bacterium]
MLFRITGSMDVKFFLAGLFLTFVCGAWYFDPERTKAVSPPALTDSPGFSLLTWNVGYFDDELDSRAHSEDLSHIASVISGAGVDCINLQEIADSNQVSTLKGLLGARYPYDAMGKGSRTDRYVVTLSRLPFENETLTPSLVGRDSVAVRFDVSSPPLSITVVNCHADAFNSRRRRLLANYLIDWEDRAEGKKNVLLAGDFNLDLTPIESSDLFTDDKKNDSEAYSLLLRRFRDLGGQAGPTSIFNRRIDYLFLASENLETVEVRVIQGKVVGRMDHLPLLGRFKVK